MIKITINTFILHLTTLFPGYLTRFNKNLLILVVKNIQNQLSNVNVKWFKCKPPWRVFDKPSDYYPSDINDANMLIIEKNGKKFFESFSYRSKEGATLIYERNNESGKISIIEKNHFRPILKKF